MKLSFPKIVVFYTIHDRHNYSTRPTIAIQSNCDVLIPFASLVGSQRSGTLEAWMFCKGLRMFGRKGISAMNLTDKESRWKHTDFTQLTTWLLVTPLTWESRWKHIDFTQLTTWLLVTPLTWNSVAKWITWICLVVLSKYNCHKVHI